jgi:hypothetical protein
MGTLMLGSIEQIDEYVRLINAIGIEVLSYGQSQLVLVYPSLRLRPGHCGRQLSDGATQYEVTERQFERRGSVKPVRSSIALEEGAVLRVPRYL